MADLGKAYVQIIPKAEGITDKLKSTIDPGAESAGASAGSSFVGKFKGIIAGAAIGGTLITGFKAAMDEGGKLQQSFGGLETLYGDAATAAKEYAMEAAKAGISANDYAEQAVSFGASLKAAFGGDTAKAAEAANTAILDMADNSAKMGTSIESIQNAYQGFAKQNYTMLDNLKLGYGGTKSEMERLLADATKLSGVEYNMDNLGDVYEAIHVIQEDLGLTGVAADEAASTFTGSFGAMKASASNLLAALSLGTDIEPALRELVGNAQAFLVNNLFPMIGNVVQQIPVLISTFAAECAPGLLATGGELLTSLVNGIAENLPVMAYKAADAIRTFAEGIGQGDSSELIAKAGELITTFATAMVETAGALIPAAIDAIFLLITQTDWLGLGSDMVNAVWEGMKAVFPMVDYYVDECVAKICDYLGFTGLFEEVQTEFQNIKDAITAPINEAKQLVDTAVSNIKRIFPINMGKIFSGVKLPHFHISGGEIPWGIGGMGTKPSVSIDWYARGGIINSPKIIGVGEAGPEAIVPLSGSYVKPFADAVADAVGGSPYTIIVPVTLDGREIARASAIYTKQELDRMQRNTERKAGLAW